MPPTRPWQELPIVPVTLSSEARHGGEFHAIDRFTYAPEVLPGVGISVYVPRGHFRRGATNLDGGFKRHRRFLADQPEPRVAVSGTIPGIGYLLEGGHVHRYGTG